MTNRNRPSVSSVTGSVSSTSSGRSSVLNRPDHEGRDQRRAEARDRDAGVQVGHQQQGGGEQQPADDDLHGAKNTCNSRRHSWGLAGCAAIIRRAEGGVANGARRRAARQYVRWPPGRAFRARSPDAVETTSGLPQDSSAPGWRNRPSPNRASNSRSLAMNSVAPDWLWAVLHRVGAGRAVRRLRRAQEAGRARGHRARGDQVVGDLGGAQPRLQRPLLVGAEDARGPGRRRRGEHPRGRVPDRLPDREVAGGRQHLRVPDDLHLLRGAAGVPEAGADDRHHRRDRAAHGDDPGRRLADRAVPLGAVPVRRLPAAHRHQDVVGRGQGAEPRGQPGAQAAAPRDAGAPRASTARSSGRSRTASASRRRC